MAARLGHALAQHMAAPRGRGLGCRMAAVRAGPGGGFLLVGRKMITRHANHFVYSILFEIIIRSQKW